MVTVKRELEADDFRAFNAFVVRTAGGPGPLLAGAVLVVLVALAYVPFLAFGWDWDVGTSVAAAAVVLAWAVILGRANNRAVAPAPDGLLLEPSELTVADEGLFDRSPRAESLVRWAAVRKVVVTDRHIFILFDRVLGLIVPRYDFADEAAENEFLQEVHRRCPDSVEWSNLDRSKE
jgi:YcxB-like protein